MIIPHARVRVRSEAIERVVRLLSNGVLSAGVETAALEQDVMERWRLHAAAVSSGTAALFLALRALGVKAGQEVLIPAFTCNSVRAAVELTGAHAVAVDCRSRGLTMDVEKAVRRIRSERTGAVIVTHQFGFECEVGPLLDVPVPLIEDCAHAPLVPGNDGALLGSRGDAAVLSFYATKWFSGAEGGCVLSKNAGTVEQVRRLRNPDTDDPPPGAFNFKLSDVHAALARAHLHAIDQALAERRRIAAEYDQTLGAWALHRRADFDEFHACVFRYLLYVPGKAAEVVRAAEAVGIACTRPIRFPLHRVLGGHCPRADHLYESLVSVPCFPGLTDAEIRCVCSELPKILSRL